MSINIKIIVYVYKDRYADDITSFSTNIIYNLPAKYQSRLKSTRNLQNNAINFFCPKTLDLTVKYILPVRISATIFHLMLIHLCLQIFSSSFSYINISYRCTKNIFSVMFKSPNAFIYIGL